MNPFELHELPVGEYFVRTDLVAVQMKSPLPPLPGDEDIFLVSRADCPTRFQVQDPPKARQVFPLPD